MPAVVIAVAAVVSAGYAIYSGERSAAEAKKAMNKKPPAPANYYEYDTNGNIVSQQVWDAEKNAYISTPGNSPENQERQKLREQLLSNLAKTPEDRIRAYNDYATAYSDTLHRETDIQHSKDLRSINENMNARGMIGSRAYADIQAELERERLNNNVDIANRATMAKNDLANQDRAYWSGLLNQLDSGGKVTTAQAMSGAHMGTSATLPAYQIYQSNAANLANMGQRNSQNYMNTSVGLAYLYGYGNKGASVNEGNIGGGGVNDYYQPSTKGWQPNWSIYSDSGRA